MIDRIVTVIVAIIVVATLAVIVSNRSNASSFIDDTGNFFASLISKIVRPVN